jgi:hypothetical protein
MLTLYLFLTEKPNGVSDSLSFSHLNENGCLRLSPKTSPGQVIDWLLPAN